MSFRPYTKSSSLAERRKKELLADKIIITFWRLIIIFIMCYMAYKIYTNVREEFIPNRRRGEEARAFQTQKGN